MAGNHVINLFISLVHTCELKGVNSFDHLTELQQYASELSSNPGRCVLELSEYAPKDRRPLDKFIFFELSGANYFAV